MRLVSIVFPHSRFTSPRHYLVWTKGITPLRAHLFTPVMIDAETGELAGVLRLPWYVRCWSFRARCISATTAGCP